ncbi:hypothetical protein [Nostoc sp. NMS4]|uniref:hypothetical protein n=1 Tax=Nostoc sp. NMS4 TaxID=2815390 RepID=UPI0025D34FE5|nr:hypothetical protein [Nostoc sp. NMS4]MBN3924617.1 hypothetical protein [Nostoc sp. NMS4]
MPKKKRELSPETIEKLQGLKRESESSPKVLQFKFPPFCDLEEVRRQKAIKRQLKLEKKNLEKLNPENKKTTSVATQSSCEIKDYCVAPTGEQKPYKKGWDYARAQAARQRIAISKPWIYSTGAVTKLGKRIVSRNALKHGLYSKVLQSSTLEYIEFSVATADIEREEDINDTSSGENEDD